MVLEYRTGKVIGGEGKGAVQDVVVRGRHGGADQQVGGFGEVHMFHAAAGTPLAHLEHREQPPRVRGQVDEPERPVVQEIDAVVGERADVLFPELEQA